MSAIGAAPARARRAQHPIALSTTSAHSRTTTRTHQRQRQRARSSEQYEAGEHMQMSAARRKAKFAHEAINHANRKGNHSREAYKNQ